MKRIATALSKALGIIMRRSTIAIVSMALGIIMITAGSMVAFGMGVGLIVGGLCLAALALLLGWDS